MQQLWTSLSHLDKKVTTVSSETNECFHPTIIKQHWLLLPVWTLSILIWRLTTLHFLPPAHLTSFLQPMFTPVLSQKKLYCVQHFFSRHLCRFWWVKNVLKLQHVSEYTSLHHGVKTNSWLHLDLHIERDQWILFNQKHSDVSLKD